VGESAVIGTNGNLREPEQLLLTPEQASVRLAICRTRIYELMASGQLESVRIGSSRRIPASALVDFVQRLRSGVNIQVGRRPEDGPFSVESART
jgi:excisionase family DNA binding protein